MITERMQYLFAKLLEGYLKYRLKIGKSNWQYRQKLIKDNKT